MEKTIKKITGYAVYKETIRKKSKQSGNFELYSKKLPNQQFDIIYADPPWDYNGKIQYDKSSTCISTIDLSKNIYVGGAIFKYPTLKLKELKMLQVEQIAKDNCILFLWTTNPHLKQAISLGEAWGFEYRTVAFVWDKMIHNPGQYTLSNCELCLLFKKGKIPTPRGARNIQQLIQEKRREHSRKPDKIRENIDKMFPTQQRIELFAREKVDNWHSWGLEITDSND